MVLLCFITNYCNIQGDFTDEYLTSEKCKKCNYYILPSVYKIKLKHDLLQLNEKKYTMSVQMRKTRNIHKCCSTVQVCHVGILVLLLHSCHYFFNCTDCCLLFLFLGEHFLSYQNSNTK